MKFRIIKKTKNEKERYELFYLDEYNRTGQTWKQVIWDEEGYCRFQDCNYTETAEEAYTKAVEFAKEYKKDHGALIKEFEITDV